MTELTIEQKRFAIEKGLAQFIPEPVLQRVLQYWENEYGHQPSFVLNRFLSEICTNDELRLQRKDMLRQVLHEISVVEKQQHLKEKPNKDKENDSAEEPIEALDLFQAFYDFVMEVLKSVNRNDYLDFVEDIQSKMKKHRVLAAYRYSAGSEKKCLMEIPMDAYAAMITILYAIYCDFYGPSKADQLYAQIKHYLKQRYPNIELQQLL